MSTTDGVTHNTAIATELGGAVLDAQSGATIDVQSGAILEVDSGGALEIAGVDVTSQVAGLVNAITDGQRFIGLENVLKETAGTWTMTRIAQGDYGLVKTATAETAVIGIDITEAIRTTTSKGFKLASIDVISKVATADLTSQTLTLQKLNYANNVANAVTAVTVASSGACSAAVQANPYVDNLAVTTPAYDNTAVSKYVAEITVVAATTSVYTFYGLNLHFTKSAA